MLWLWCSVNARTKGSFVFVSLAIVALGIVMHLPSYNHLCFPQKTLHRDIRVVHTSRLLEWSNKFCTSRDVIHLIDSFGISLILWLRIGTWLSRLTIVILLTLSFPHLYASIRTMQYLTHLDCHLNCTKRTTSFAWLGMRSLCSFAMLLFASLSVP